jgi:Zn-dependent alcohol dehydrogenase
MGTRYATTSNAAILETAGSPLRIRAVRIEAPRDGEVLVRIAAAGVCHSDYLYASGALQHPVPVILGHEGAGVVESVGPGVRSLSPGDHVVLLWRSTCGRCEACSMGRASLCGTGRSMRAAGTLLDGTTRITLDGAPVHHFLGLSCFSERAVINEEALLKVPADIPLDLVAIAGCAVITGAGAIFNAARVQPGDVILVVGAGGVGVSAIAAAAAVGAVRIVAVDRVRERLDFALTFGATDVVLLDSPGCTEELRRLLGEGASVAVECAGTPEAIGLAVEMVGPGGIAVLLGGHGPATLASFAARDFIVNEKMIVGSIAGTMRPARDFARLFAMYRAGRLPIDRMLGRRYPLESVNEAYADLLAGSVGRSVLVVSPEDV